MHFFYVHKFQISPWQVQPRYMLDKDLIYKLTPNSVTYWKTSEFLEIVTSNGLGIRSLHNTSINKMPHTYRVLLSGASFTFGEGLKDKETISANMESVLNASSSAIRYEVLNRAVPGYSPDQEYRSLMKDIPIYTPDIIFWNLTPGDMDGAIMKGADIRMSLYDLLPNGNLKALNAQLNHLYIRSYLFIHTPNFIRNTNLFDALVVVLTKIPWLSGLPQIPAKELRPFALKKFIREAQNIKNSCIIYKCTLVITWLPRKEYPVDIPFPAEKLNSLNIKNLNILAIVGLHEDNFFPKDGHFNSKGAKSVADVLSEYVLNITTIPPIH